MGLSDLLSAILALFRRCSGAVLAPSLSPSSAPGAAQKPATAAPVPVVAPVVQVPVTAARQPTLVGSSTDSAFSSTSAQVSPGPTPHWIDLCRPMTEHFERCVLIAYPDPASELGEAIQARGQWEHVLNGMAIPQDLMHLDGAPWTCGYGCTGADIVYGTVWTQAHADSQLTIRLNQAADAVDRHVKVELTPGQKAALTDFVFNEGETNFASSTLLRLLNASDFAGAAAQFPRWDLARGKVLAGLVERRAAEKQLFTTGAWQP